MPKTKIPAAVDGAFTGRITARMAARKLGDRSQAIEAAIVDELNRIDRWRLSRDCAELDRVEERE